MTLDSMLPLSYPKLRSALASLATLVLIAACSGGSGNPQQLMAAAQQYQSAGKHAAAIIELRNLLAIEPQNFEARRLLALSYTENGEPGAAEDELRKAIEYGLDARSVTTALGRVLLLQGKHERLLQDIQPAPDMNQHDAVEISVLRGLASLALGKADDAKILLARAVETDPANSDALLGLAAIEANASHFDKAAELIEQSIKANPNNVDAWLVRGDFHRLRGKPEVAIESYRRAAELQPANVNANLQLASLYMEQERFDDARKHLDAVRKKLPDNAFVYYANALVEFRRKNYPLAREAVEEALRKNPGHLPSLLLAGSIEYASGNYAKAIAPLRSVLERAPNNLPAQRMLAASTLRAGQVQRAIDMLEESLGAAPNDPMLLSLLAEAHVQNNDLAHALPLLERAAKSNPKNLQSRAQLQIARLMGGQTDAVLSDLEASMKTEREPGLSQQLLYAVTLIQRKQFDRALSTIAALEKKQPTPLTYNLKAAALIGTNKLEAARAALENALALDARFIPALLNLANLDLHEQGPHAARKRLENYLARDPSNADVLTALARMGPQLGASPDLVVEWLERALAANPKSVRQMLLLADAHLRGGDARKALRYAEMAQQTNPDQVDVLGMLGNVQIALGQNSGALGTFSKLALQNPKSPSILYSLARLQAASNNTAGATLTLKRALEIQPDFAPALALLGEVELQAGRTDSALQIAGQLQRAHPRMPDGFVLEGDVHRAAKEPAHAAKLYSDAYARGARGAVVGIKLHMALKEAGRDADADAFIARFSKESPDQVAIHAYIGDSLLTTGRYAEAIERYQQVLKQQPENALVLNNVAWASYQLKDRRAREYAEKAYSLRPDSPVILDTMGWLLVDAGQYERGIELLQRAVAAVPDNADTRLHLVQALVKSGNMSRARRELESVLAGKLAPTQEAQARELLRTLR